MEEIINYLNQKYQPLSLILYGSYANGTNNAGSDFDVLVIAATLRPDIFGSARLGRILFVTLLANLFVMLLCFLFRIQTMATTWVCVVLFSLYIAYDWARAQQYPKTVDNAIDCAMDIYMDIINLFLDLVRILNKD